MNTSADILEPNILQDLQDSYASTLPVYAYCYARPYERLTDFSGSETEEAFFAAHISEETKKRIIASFSDVDVENVIASETDVPYIRLCGVAIRDTRGVTLGAWIFAGVCMELLPEDVSIPEEIACTTAGEFEHIIALIEKTSGMYFAAHGKNITADERLLEISDVEKRIDEEKRRNEALSDVLKLLDADGDFGVMVSDILHIAGDYLKLSDALLLREDPNEDVIDVVSDYATDEADGLTKHFLTLRREEIPFFTGREYTVSSDSIMPDAFRDFFRRYDITAGVFLPVEGADDAMMYLCFMMRHTSRKWFVKELTFLNDIRRVVASLLATRLAQNSMAGCYAALDAILENTADGVAVYARDDGTEIYTNERFGAMLSDAQDMQGLRQTLDEINKEDAAQTDFFAEKSKRWYRLHTAPIRWMDGRGVCFTSLYDITESKQYKQRMQEQAKTDYLTGLYNRRQFEKDVEVAIKDAVRSGEGGSFLYMNLDAFKDLNGELGHKSGDLLLKEAANALTGICKAKASCYRIGGDEFAVLVPFFEYNELNKLVGTIKRRFEQPWTLDGTEYFGSMSMGVVCFPKDGGDAQTLMHHADVALEMAKKRGQGTVEWYSDEDEAKNLKRVAMEKAMHRAVESGCEEFEVYYQPLMDASKEGRPCVGAEALVRWQSKELGFVKPDDFISVAEYLGLIVPIGTHVLHQACRQCRYWNDFGHPEYRIHVNMSVIQLVQADVVDVVRDAIAQTGIDPKNLTLEITESVAIRDMAKIKRTLNEIRSMGVRFSMDDFGTGYSSLNRLKELPLDEIKIDKSFVDDLMDDEFSEAFVETVTNLADTINVEVVVEGVEQKAQASELGKMHVNTFQGYLFDKPLTDEEFEKKYLT